MLACRIRDPNCRVSVLAILASTQRAHNGGLWVRPYPGVGVFGPSSRHWERAGSHRLERCDRQQRGCPDRRAADWWLGACFSMSCVTSYSQEEWEYENDEKRSRDLGLAATAALAILVGSAVPDCRAAPSP